MPALTPPNHHDVGKYAIHGWSGKTIPSSIDLYNNGLLSQVATECKSNILPVLEEIKLVRSSCAGRTNSTLDTHNVDS